MAEPSKKQEPLGEEADAKEVEVEIVEDNDIPPEDKGKQPAKAEAADPDEEELAQYSESVKKRINQLSRARHDARRAKEEAERERDETFRIAQAIVQENEQLKNRLSKGESVLAKTMDTSASAEVAVAKRELKEAMEAYDAERIVEAQEKLNRAVVRAEQTRTFQARVQRQEQEGKQRSAQQQPRQVQPQQPQPQVDPRAQQWQKDNDWFGSEPEMTAFAIGYHNRLTSDHGAAYATTDEYYSKINTRMREKFPEYFGDQGKQPKTEERPASVVAPATRSTPPKRIVLTKRQADIARRLNVPPELYAQKLAELENPNG